MRHEDRQMVILEQLLVFLRFLVTLQYCSTAISAPVLSENMVQ